MHIRQESENYTRECYALQLDIRGYFMHIDRMRLLEIATKSLKKMSKHEAREGLLWEDVIDMDFVLWLTKEIVLLNPRGNCKIVGTWDDWNGLDKNKSLFYTEEGKGLPIGNLTSQLFSNVYMNAFDQYMKRTLGCKHYGRYVDDAYVIGRDKEWLLSLVPRINTFLRDNLGLEIHMGKLHLIDVKYGVCFLGAFVKPHRVYVSNMTLKRMLASMGRMNMGDHEAVYRSVNSYLGTLRHYKTYKIRSAIFLKEKFLKIGGFDRNVTKMVLPKFFQ